MRATIIGAGNAGCAWSAVLEKQGIETLLYAHPDHSTFASTILDQGYLETTGLVEGRWHPQVTFDMRIAVEFSNILIISTPCDAHQTILALLEAFDLSQHKILAILGTLFAPLAQRTIKPQYLFEISDSPWVSRTKDGQVFVKGIKDVVQIAALPKFTDEAVRAEINLVLPIRLAWRNSVLDIFFSTIAGVVHTVTVLMNVGWIESTRGQFTFYKQGMSHSVCKIITAMDKERLLVSKAYGVDSWTVLETFNKYYKTTFSSFEAVAKGSRYHNANAPYDLIHRYVTQDCPYWLVPFRELAAKANIAVPYTDAFILQASAVNEERYEETGRSLDMVGIGHMSASEIRDYFDGRQEIGVHKVSHATPHLSQVERAPSYNGKHVNGTKTNGKGV